VLGFSFTLPATRLAVADLDATFVGLGRAVVAGVLAAIVLGLLREPPPPRRALPRLGVVALGVVVGFPLLSALALRHLTAAHGAVIVGLLPAATAAMAVIRAGERPSPAFWAASGAGLVAVLAFAATQGAGLPQAADLLVLAAVAVAAVGYTEGATLAREMGGWRVISWALVLSLPVVAPAAYAGAAGGGLHAGTDAWLGFAYVAVVSQFLAFFAWYAGLARGGVARIGQVQLAQPLLTLVWSAALIGEHVGVATVVAHPGHTA
jgi:drug/metabolite transporter (DMT)-like permease